MTATNYNREYFCFLIRMRLCWEMQKRQQMSGLHVCYWSKKHMPYKNSAIQKSEIGRRKKYHFRNKVKNVKNDCIHIITSTPTLWVWPVRGFEINFMTNPFCGPAAWFFVIIREFIFTLIFEIKIHKKPLTPIKWCLQPSLSRNFWFKTPAKLKLWAYCPIISINYDKNTDCIFQSY